METQDRALVGVFHFDESRGSFEDFSHSNDVVYWYGSDLADMLGYESAAAFDKAVNRAIVACNALKIAIMDNFIQCRREIDGRQVMDYKLTRFACYLTAMNGDVRKPQVAAAQAYFATIASAFQQYLQQSQDVERVAVREDVSERERSLAGHAHRAGVENYAFFQSAGYRGMYNMTIARLRQIKGVPDKRSPLDFMAKDELAANLFRITQTEMKIRNEGVRGQTRLEEAAETVGRKVRQTMVEISGVTPESIPPGQDLNDVRKGLKLTHRKFKQIDGHQKKKKKTP